MRASGLFPLFILRGCYYSAGPTPGLAKRNVLTGGEGGTGLRGDAAAM